jgi:2-methylisocitrate lyase-like PEP mutase family enzyme
VGANLEDGLPAPEAVLRPAAAHRAIVRAARDAADAVGLADAVINARTDVFWSEIGARSSRLDQAVDRLREYEDAGADCLFVPGFPEPTLTAHEAERQLRVLLGAVSAPVNLLIDPRMPLSLRRLAELGVRRVSTGSTLYRVALASARHSARRVLQDSDLAALAPASELGYQELLITLTGTSPRARRH